MFQLATEIATEAMNWPQAAVRIVFMIMVGLVLIAMFR